VKVNLNTKSNLFFTVLGNVWIFQNNLFRAFYVKKDVNDVKACQFFFSIIFKFTETVVDYFELHWTYIQKLYMFLTFLAQIPKLRLDSCFIGSIFASMCLFMICLRN
jgi:hypothetical protein